MLTLKLVHSQQSSLGTTLGQHIPNDKNNIKRHGFVRVFFILQIILKEMQE
jgi:hypothetical protein